MGIKRVQKLYLWTVGDPSVRIAGESAEVSAPGWLVESEQYEAEDFKSVLEDFRQKIQEAFEVIWSGEKVFARYDFELQEENAQGLSH